MDRKERIKELLEQAAGLGPEERRRFLERECGGDAAMRREVEELLAAGENSPHLANSFAFKADEDETLGKILGGRYRIMEPLGKGGMGRVYLAEDTEIPVLKFAVKIFEQGFEKEVEALARVRSDRVVKIVTTGKTDDGRPFMVMEYLTGQTLAQLLKGRERPPRAEVAQLLRKVAEAAAELHETKPGPDGRGIIHRDLKPSNIMVEQRRGGWEVKLFDLGVARLHEPLMGKSTSRHVAVGTPLYMAPEQFHGEGMAAFGCPKKSLKEIVSPATDIYSLGVIAYEMVAGRHPFRGAGSPANVATMQRENSYAEALNRQGEIPRAARAVVLKAMAFCPDARYQRAEEFGEELAHALTARPPSRVRYAAAAAAVLLLMLLVAGAYVWLPKGASGTGDDRQLAGADSDKGAQGEGPKGGAAAEAEKADGQTPSAPAAEREVTYWLETQQRRGEQKVGEPKVITAEDGVADGWNLKLYVEGGERGHLYLINDGPSEQGQALRILFPIPNDPLGERPRRNDGTSEVLPGRAVEAFEGVVKDLAGTEHLWLVWSTERIPELERLTAYANERHRGKIDGRGDAEATRAFLSKLRQAEVRYDGRGRAVLRGAGNVLVKELLLRHV